MLEIVGSIVIINFRDAGASIILDSEHLVSDQDPGYVYCKSAVTIKLQQTISLRRTVLYEKVFKII
jgi:hypothetical protein